MATEITLDIDHVCMMILKARALNVKEQADIVLDGSNSIDDDGIAAALGEGEDASREELIGMIEGLNERERAELVALVWIGRGDHDAAELDEAVGIARAREQGDDAPAGRYLLTLPLLGDYLAEGLAAFGYSCAETA